MVSICTPRACNDMHKPLERATATLIFALKGRVFAPLLNIHFENTGPLTPVLSYAQSQSVGYEITPVVDLQRFGL